MAVGLCLRFQACLFSCLLGPDVWKSEDCSVGLCTCLEWTSSATWSPRLQELAGPVHTLFMCERQSFINILSTTQPWQWYSLEVSALFLPLFTLQAPSVWNNSATPTTFTNSLVTLRSLTSRLSSSYIHLSAEHYSPVGTFKPVWLKQKCSILHQTSVSSWVLNFCETNHWLFSLPIFNTAFCRV